MLGSVTGKILVKMTTSPISFACLMMVLMLFRQLVIISARRSGKMGRVRRSFIPTCKTTTWGRSGVTCAENRPRTWAVVWPTIPRLINSQPDKSVGGGQLSARESPKKITRLRSDDEGVGFDGKADNPSGSKRRAFSLA